VSCPQSEKKTQGTQKNWFLNYEAGGVCKKLGNDLDERDHEAIML
jgi:hypothetical protein